MHGVSITDCMYICSQHEAAAGVADGDRSSGAEPMRLSPDQLVNRTLERAGTGNLALQRSAAVFGTDRDNTATVDELDRLSAQSTYSFDHHRERVR